MQAKTFGRYEVREEIGDGAMGRVFRGFDPLVRRTVAIKTVKAEYLTKDTREEYLRRFRREAQAAGSLSHHNIVGIYDVGEDYIVMEYIEGITLDGLLRRRTVLGLDDTLRLLVPLADALDYAHRAGVIHRDIKPGNIIVQPDGRPKLMDFGVARLETSAITAEGVFFGSPSYMAPEQILSHEVTPRADQFSFAVVAYEVLTGSRPFHGDTITAIMYRVVNMPAPAPTTMNYDLPERFDPVFHRALDKEPDHRYGSVSEFVAALVGESQLDLNAWPPEPVPEAQVETRHASVETQALEGMSGGPATRRRHRLTRLVPAAAVLALGAEVVLLSRGRPHAEPRPERITATPPVANVSALRIETEPAGSAVEIDDHPVGLSPLALTALAAGPHRVRITRDGHAPAEIGLHLTDGVPLPPLRFVLVPLDAPLSVESEPDGAAVRVNGRLLGTTPLRGVPLFPGRHEMRLDLPGFTPQLQTVDAVAGRAVAVHARLQRVASDRLPLPPTNPTGSAPDRASAVTPPRRVSGDGIRYPEEARRLRLTGSVTVEVTVTPQGEPGNIRVLESAGAILDQAVVAAVRQWRFEPALKDGVRVPARWQFRQTFAPSR